MSNAQRKTWNIAKARPFARTHEGHILHTLICEYCFEATTPAQADRSLQKIKSFLDKRMPESSNSLFQISANGYSPIADALNMPYAKNIHIPAEFRQKKANDLLKCLVNAYHQACQRDASMQDYAELLTRPTQEGMTALHLALSHGNKAGYHTIVDELKWLKTFRTMDGGSYGRQFTIPMHDNVTPLHTAIRSGNSELLNDFLEDMQKALSREQYQRQLLQVTKSHWNVLHTATQPLESKGLPDPFIVDALQNAFYEAFGKEQAKEVLASLCMAKNQQGYPAFHTQQPQWLQRLLGLTQKDPLQPSWPGFGRR